MKKITAVLSLFVYALASIPAGAAQSSIDPIGTYGELSVSLSHAKSNQERGRALGEFLKSYSAFLQNNGNAERFWADLSDADLISPEQQSQALKQTQEIAKSDLGKLEKLGNDLAEGKVQLDEVFNPQMMKALQGAQGSTYILECNRWYTSCSGDWAGGAVYIAGYLAVMGLIIAVQYI